ncbi:hypothetical protein ABN098_22775, partial [Proteus terrae]
MHCALYDAGRCRSCQWLERPVPQQLADKMADLRTLLAAIPQVVGQEVARLNRVVQQVHKGNQAADFDTFGKGAWTFELKVNAVAALEAALLHL